MTNTTIPHEQPAFNDTVTLGFWLYLLTDLVVFAVLFATFSVLRNGVANGPTGAEIFDLPFVMGETIVLLLSSLTCGLGMIAAYRKHIRQVWGYFGATFALGALFLGMELYEFSHLIHEGYTPQTSGFLSSYFALVGTHGLHIAVGLLWLAIMFFYMRKQGLSNSIVRKLGLLSIFWHFLDVVWIFVFTVVYLMGAAS
jgi:cytochrome o ubiquinol oxidase subunit III